MLVYSYQIRNRIQEQKSGNQVGHRVGIHKDEDSNNESEYAYENKLKSQQQDKAEQGQKGGKGHGNEFGKDEDDGARDDREGREGCRNSKRHKQESQCYQVARRNEIQEIGIGEGKQACGQCQKCI